MLLPDIEYRIVGTGITVEAVTDPAGVDDTVVTHQEVSRDMCMSTENQLGTFTGDLL